MEVKAVGLADFVRPVDLLLVAEPWSQHVALESVEAATAASVETPQHFKAM